MENIYSFNVKWDLKHLSLFAFLLLIPNLLGMINLSTGIGFKLHFFQYAVFLAAIIYGPFGGLLSGLVGSVYSAITMHNPYIIICNAVLGFFVGYFARKGLKTLFAVWLAFIIELPLLILADHYLAGLPIAFILPLIVALAVSNTVWAVAAQYSARFLR